MNLNKKVNLIVEFCEEKLEDEDYLDFFNYNDLGIPLAIALNLGYIKLKSAGEEILAETWTELCSILNTDPNAKYETLDSLLAQSKSAVDIELSIDLNNDGHKALNFGDAELALEKWTSAAELGQPNAYTSLVWLNMFLNRFDLLDSIMSDYEEKTMNWRNQYDSLVGDPSIGAEQFDGQVASVSYNCALSEWLKGDVDSAKRYLSKAGEDAEAKYLRHVISGESLEALGLSENESNELIGIYEKVIEDLERIEGFDSSFTQPWDGKTCLDFAKTAIERLKTA
jgi:tetratricopeptide (TPR) repeat protein